MPRLILILTLLVAFVLTTRLFVSPEAHPQEEIPFIYVTETDRYTTFKSEANDRVLLCEHIEESSCGITVTCGGKVRSCLSAYRFTIHPKVAD